MGILRPCVLLIFQPCCTTRDPSIPTMAWTIQHKSTSAPTGFSSKQGTFSSLPSSPPTPRWVHYQREKKAILAPQCLPCQEWPR